MGLTVSLVGPGGTNTSNYSVQRARAGMGDGASTIPAKSWGEQKSHRDKDPNRPMFYYGAFAQRQLSTTALSTAARVSTG
jgi:hypothetical protein